MKRVLSIQSHVVHGYVGGRAANFPLQYLGWDVDNINTVNLSNHTGYGLVQGSHLEEPQLAELVDKLADLGCRYDAVITGYIPTAGLIRLLAARLRRLKDANPDLTCVCDPVLGDQGNLYVSEACIAAYKDLLAARCVDLITPNHFELELLCGFAVDSPRALKRAVHHLHSTYGIPHVVVSSIPGSVPLGAGPEPNVLHCAAWSQDGPGVSVFRIPEIKSYFTGVGDLFTALLTAKFSDVLLLQAVNQVLTIMASVLQLTHTSAINDYCASKGIAPLPDAFDGALQGIMNDKLMKHFELRIVQARSFYDYSGLGTYELYLI